MSKNRGLRILLAAIVLLSLPIIARPARAQVTAGAVVRIMPFGDSITSSVGVDWPSGPQASYRYWLDHDLHNNLLPFEFMGTRIDNYDGAPKYLDFDRHNDGWSGFTTGYFLDGIHDTDMNTILSSDRYGTTEPNVPDIVLLHLGTNDVYQGIATNTSKENLSKIIDEFRLANPNVVILLAKIIPCDPTHALGPNCNNIPTFNNMIPTLASAKTKTQSPVIVVDQYTGFDATAGTDTYDGVHPNQSGEIKMANKWLAAILAWWNQTHSHVFVPIILVPV